MEPVLYWRGHVRFKLGQQLNRSSKCFRLLVLRNDTGVFLVAFYARKVKGNAVFVAAVVTELVIVLLFILNEYGKISLGFLWLNMVGAVMVYVLAVLLQRTIYRNSHRRLS